MEQFDAASHLSVYGRWPILMIFDRLRELRFGIAATPWPGGGSSGKLAWLPTALRLVLPAMATAVMLVPTWDISG